MSGSSHTRVDAILKTLTGGPDVRENILADEVRRLRAERAAMQAKVNDARVDAESHHRQTSSSYHEGQLDALDLVQQWLDSADKRGGT